MLSNNPSVSFADSSPYTGEPTAATGLLNGKSLYGTTRLAGGFREPKNHLKTDGFEVIFIYFRILHVKCHITRFYKSDFSENFIEYQ